MDIFVTIDHHSTFSLIKVMFLDSNELQIQLF